MSISRTTGETILRVGIVVFTLATALIHLQLAFPDSAFILNGFGYLALLAALYLPLPRVARYRNILRWVLVGYAALSILLWIFLGARTLIGYIDKAIEISLIALLLLEARNARSSL